MEYRDQMAVWLYDSCPGRDYIDTKRPQTHLPTPAAQLTKSSPESAPPEVMDSLLAERAMRLLDRGAVAASSAIFFFSLANISCSSLYQRGTLGIQGAGCCHAATSGRHVGLNANLRVVITALQVNKDT